MQGFKILGLALVLCATNSDVFRRYKGLAIARQWGAVLQCSLQWIVAFIAIAAILFSDLLAIRICWGGMIALSGAANWLFFKISHSQLTVLDVASLWQEREVKNNAISLYAQPIRQALLLFAASWALFVLPALAPFGLLWLQISELPWLSLVSIAGIITVFWVQRGVSFAPMPAQFLLPAVAALTAFLIFARPPLRRRAVDWVPMAAPAQSIVLLMDESIRGDYISMKNGNGLTPRLADLAEKFVDFGCSVSGANNSASANAIVRFGARLNDLGQSVTSNPSVFSFAKKAGFRTVYINAQNKFTRDGNVLMNYMTLDETREIDAFYVTKSEFESDYELADIIAKELSSGRPVFIYANKMGAHFPYEWCYPAADGKRKSRRAWGRSNHATIAAYRKAITWNVENFFHYLFEKTDLSQTTLIYTSDHGQLFRNGEFPHGQIHNPDPRTGLVPLLAYTPDPKIRALFEVGAAKSRGKASHFQIAPTLYQLMGYGMDDIARIYPATLFTGTESNPQMTSGAIFPLFPHSFVLTDVDPTLDYFESTMNASPT